MFDHLPARLVLNRLTPGCGAHRAPTWDPTIVFGMVPPGHPLPFHSSPCLQYVPFAYFCSRFSLFLVHFFFPPLFFFHYFSLPECIVFSFSVLLCIAFSFFAFCSLPCSPWWRILSCVSVLYPPRAGCNASLQACEYAYYSLVFFSLLLFCASFFPPCRIRLRRRFVPS